MIADTGVKQTEDELGDALVSLKTVDQVVAEIADGTIAPEDAPAAARALVRRLVRRSERRAAKQAAAS